MIEMPMDIGSSITHVYTTAVLINMYCSPPGFDGSFSVLSANRGIIPPIAPTTAAAEPNTNHFVCWRLDKRPQDCRYDQLEVTPAYELERVFGARAGSV